jgi:hypothetical protein
MALMGSAVFCVLGVGCPQCKDCFGGVKMFAMWVTCAQ